MSDEPIRVLLVDDDPDFRRGLAGWLSRRGYQVDTAAHGEAALRCMAQGPPYQVALIDFALEPGPNGIEVMRRIRLHDPEIAPVIFTGFGLDPRDGLEAMRAGAYRYLPKSADKEEIDILIRSAVDHYGIRRQLARTIEKVETLQVLSEARQRKLTELTALNEIGRAIAATVQLNQLPRLIYKQTSRVIDTTNFFVALYEWETHQLNFVLRYEHGERVAPHRHSADRGLTGYLVRQRRPLLLHSVEENRIFRDEQRVELIGEEARSWLGVPIISGDRVLGAIAVQDYEREGAYGEDQWELLQIIANYAAVAIENAELFAQLDRVGQAARAVTMSLELRKVLRRIVTLAAEVAHSDHTSVVLVEDGEPVDSVEDFGDRFPEIPPLHQRARPDGRTREVIRTGEPVVFDRVKADDQTHNPYLHDVGIRSYAGLPLRVKEELVGVLFVHSFDPGAFQRSIELLTIFAYHAAIAIVNARLFRDVQERAQTLNTLLRVEQQIISAIPDRPKAVLERIAQGACEVTGADCAVIYPYIAQRRAYEAESVAAHGLLQPDRLRPSDKVREYGVAAGIIGDPEGMRIVANIEQEDPQLRHDSRFIRREQIQAFVGVRLDAGDEAVGVLFVNWRQPHHPSTDGVNMIKILANHAAIAIQNARLYERASDRLQKRVEELELLHQIDRQITATLKPGRVFELILEAALELTDGQRGELWLMDDAKGELALEMAQGEPLGEPGPTRQGVGQGVVGKAVRDRQLWLVPDVGHGFWARIYPRNRSQVRSVMAVPLLLGDEVLGAIAVESPESNAFDQDEQHLLERLAAQAVIAIQNATRYQAVERQRAHLEAIHNATKTISSSLDLDWILVQLVRHVRDMLVPEACSIALRDEETGDLIFEATEGPGADVVRGMHLERGRGIAGWVAESGEPLMVLDTSQDPRFFPGVDEKTSFQSRSILCVPMSVKGRVVGVIEAVNPPTTMSVQEQMEVLEALAGLTAIAIENARQYEELNRAKEETAAAEAVAWMGIFGSNWSHGINQRTFAIRNYLATLRTTLPTEGLPSELLDLIEEATNEIQHIPLTSQLPVTPGAVQTPVEIDGALREQVEKWCKRRDDVERVYHLGCATVQAAIDREWLDVALEKLINNALKAMLEGGRLEIASERVGERIFVRLADTGRGIPDETRPYFLKQSIPHETSIKMERKGTGVGVLIARLIFRRYGGDLELLWSERGKGTVLRITLPCAQESTPREK